jgi:hypothetical protein
LCGASGYIGDVVFLNELIIANEDRSNSHFGLPESPDEKDLHWHVLLFGQNGVVRFKVVLLKELFSTSDLQVQLQD